MDEIYTRFIKHLPGFERGFADQNVSFFISELNSMIFQGGIESFLSEPSENNLQQPATARPEQKATVVENNDAEKDEQLQHSSEDIVKV